MDILTWQTLGYLSTIYLITRNSRCTISVALKNVVTHAQNFFSHKGMMSQKMEIFDDFLVPAVRRKKSTDISIFWPIISLWLKKFCACLTTFCGATLMVDRESVVIICVLYRKHIDFRVTRSHRTHIANLAICDIYAMGHFDVKNFDLTAENRYKNHWFMFYN